jgi:hypothetical protein
MIDLTVECMYSCSLCGVTKRKVMVPARGDENVVAYVEKVAVPRLVADHLINSPGCKPEKFAEVYIPVTNDGVVGGATKQ